MNFETTAYFLQKKKLAVSTNFMFIHDSGSMTGFMSKHGALTFDAGMVPNMH